MIRKFQQVLLDIIIKYSSGETLARKVSSGGIWLGTASGIEQALRLVRNMILTRLIAPEAFGLMAIAISINAAFESFTQIGVKEAIIQNSKGEERTYLNGAWWLSFGRSLSIYSVMWVSSPWIAQFYEIPQLVPLIRTVFLSVIFNGMMSVESYVTIKQMNFKKWVFIFHGGGVLGVLSAVILALVMPNVWALVIGYTIESAARCILSYAICPFLPRIVFDRKNMNTLLKFSRGVFGLPILTYIYMNVDIFVIGKIYSMADLGLYSMAAVLAWVPFNFITSLINQISLPAFSSKQKDNEWINKWTLNLTSLIAFAGFPLFFFIAFYGKEILSLIYGPKYETVSIPFAIMFANALIRTTTVPIGTVYFAIGRPEIHRLFTGVRTVIILILIFPAVKYFGLIGAASAGLLSMLIGSIFQVKRMHGITGINVHHYFKIFWVSLLFSLCVVFACIVAISISSSHPLIKMLPGLMGCLLSYFFMFLYVLKEKKLIR